MHSRSICLWSVCIGIFQTPEVKHWVGALEQERQQTTTSTLSKN